MSCLNRCWCIYTWVLELKNAVGFLHGTCVLCSSLHVDETSQRLGRICLSCALVEFPSAESNQKHPRSPERGHGVSCQPAISNKRDEWKTVGFGNTLRHIKGAFTTMPFLVSFQWTVLISVKNGRNLFSNIRNLWSNGKF